MKYRTVIFDLDGTLLNTLEDLMNAVNFALERFGYPKRTLAQVRAFVGNGVRRLMERALPQGSANPQFADVFAAFKEYYGAHCEDTTRAYEGIPKLLLQLAASGCRLAIVSNKLDSAVKELHASYFQECVAVAIGEKEGVRRKPAPDMVNEALAQLGSTKQETLYVGDSDVDIMTAANAGIACVSVSWGFRDADFLWENGATVVVDTPEQLLEWIKEQ